MRLSELRTTYFNAGYFLLKVSTRWKHTLWSLVRNDLFPLTWLSQTISHLVVNSKLGRTKKVLFIQNVAFIDTNLLFVNMLSLVSELFSFLSNDRIYVLHIVEYCTYKNEHSHNLLDHSNFWTYNVNLIRFFFLSGGSSAVTGFFLGVLKREPKAGIGSK